MDGIKDRVRSAKVAEEHDKEAMVGQLMELSVSTLMVMMKDSGYSHQNLGGVCMWRVHVCIIYVCLPLISN